MKKIVQIIFVFIIIILLFGFKTQSVSAVTVQKIEISQNTSVGMSYGGCYETGPPVNVKAIIKEDDGTYSTKTIRLDSEETLPLCQTKLEPTDRGWFECSLTWNNSGTKHIKLGWGTAVVNWFYNKDGIVVKDTCSPDEIVSDVTPMPSPVPVSESFNLCKQTGVPGEEAFDSCEACVEVGGIWTALGCIPTEPTGLIQTLIKIGLMVGGGIATLIILAGGFMLSISQGDPKKTSEAKDMISAAVIGLIFIVFSISILQLIGVQILQIPEFGAR